MIAFLLASNRILYRYLFSDPFTVSGLNPRHKVSNSDGITIFSTVNLISFQYFEMTGQSQNTWKYVALLLPQDLQQDVLTPREILWAGTLKKKTNYTLPPEFCPGQSRSICMLLSLSHFSFIDAVSFTSTSTTYISLICFHVQGLTWSRVEISSLHPNEFVAS